MAQGLEGAAYWKLLGKFLRKMEDYMKLSLLLPTLGDRKSELIRLFDSLVIQEYPNFEVIVLSQANYRDVDEIIRAYDGINIIHVKLSRKGLSYARNRGLERASGDIIVLSDDDCWYHSQSLKILVDTFQRHENLKVLLTQIYDPDTKKAYKKYRPKAEFIASITGLMSRSSIEIAFRRTSCDSFFDEQFGLGSTYVCGEEIDFLINNFQKGRFYLYKPVVTVFHPIKRKTTGHQERVYAKGALYAKNFCLPVSILVILRDLIMKGQNNLTPFSKGYKHYISRAI